MEPAVSCMHLVELSRSAKTGTAETTNSNSAVTSTAFSDLLPDVPFCPPPRFTGGFPPGGSFASSSRSRRLSSCSAVDRSMPQGLQPQSSAERPRMRERSLSQMIIRVIAHARATPNRIESSDSTAQHLRTPASAGCPSICRSVQRMPGNCCDQSLVLASLILSFADCVVA